MAFDETDEERIQAIESKLNEIQLAVNSLATKTQLNQLLLILSKRLDELDAEITQVEETGYGGALSSHRVDSAAHNNLLNYFNRNEHVDTSAGAADAGKPVVLDSTGQIDSSMLVEASVTQTRSMGIVFNGQGQVLQTGGLFAVQVPLTGTLSDWTITADQTGSLEIDLWKDTLGNFPPTIADTIVGGNYPALVSAQTNTDSTLTGWTTSVTKGQWIFFSLRSATSITYATLVLTITS